MAAPTLDDVLTLIATEAEGAMRKLGAAIERREMHSFSHLFANLYLYVLLLKNMKEDFDLPGQWPETVNDMWNEMEYLRALSTEISRKAVRK